MKCSSAISVLAIFGLIQLSLGEVNVKFSKASGDHPKSAGAKGVKQCGGEGEFNQLRVEGCDSKKTCSQKADGGKLKAEIDFTPKIDMDKLRFKITAFMGGNPLVMHDDAIKKSSVKKGEKYTISMKADGSKAMAGQTVNGKYEIYNDADKSLRVCVELAIEWTGSPLGLGK